MTQQLRVARRESDGGASEPPVARLCGDSLARLSGIEVNAAVELGRAELRLRDLACLGPGSVVRLDRMIGEPADLMVNGRPFARGEIVIVDDHLGLRVIELLAEHA
jgi:flagellar motor switch protein FliN/FliY